MESKRARLEALLRELGQVAVALSGGVDSTTLAAVAAETLGVDHVVALTVRSPLQSADEIETAKAIAEALGIRHIVRDVNELTILEVAGNHTRRCYHCKRARFSALAEAVAGLEGAYVLVHGENADDTDDYRPGAVAARELGVRAPLAEAGLTKAELRALARELGLPTWDRPAAPCLATRFRTGRELTPDLLARIEQAERIVREMVGVDDCRVRDEGETARIELEQAGMIKAIALDTRLALVKALRSLGYKRITLDLAGYKMGSMNDVIR